MTWVKLDDHFFMHPKVMACGPSAAWLWVASIGYSNANLTSGYIPSRALPMLSMTTSAKASALAAKLVEARLWEPADGGFKIHDYEHWNLPADEIRSHRENLSKVRSDAGRIGGRKSGEARSEAKTKQVAYEATKQNASPSPTPTPTPTQNGGGRDPERASAPEACPPPPSAFQANGSGPRTTNVPLDGESLAVALSAGVGGLHGVVGCDAGLLVRLREICDRREWGDRQMRRVGHWLASHDAPEWIVTKRDGAGLTFSWLMRDNGQRFVELCDLAKESFERARGAA